jgi:hypothetical protein
MIRSTWQVSCHGGVAEAVVLVGLWWFSKEQLYNKQPVAWLLRWTNVSQLMWAFTIKVPGGMLLCSKAALEVHINILIRDAE